MLIAQWRLRGIGLHLLDRQLQALVILAQARELGAFSPAVGVVQLLGEGCTLLFTLFKALLQLGDPGAGFQRQRLFGTGQRAQQQ